MFQSRNRVWAVHALWHRQPRRTSHQFQSRNRVWAVHAGKRLSKSMLASTVSISQSSLGGSRTPPQSPDRAAISEFQSRNRVWAVHALTNALAWEREESFNLAIEFGRFTRRLDRASRVVLACFNLAIEFGRFTPSMMSKSAPCPVSFNLAIEFGPVHAYEVSLWARSPSFNLAIEFGRFTLCPLRSSRRRLQGFQSRNRVWAVHARNPAKSIRRRRPSSMFQSRNRVWAVHAASLSTCDGGIVEFQSRNRVWAVHAREAA